MTVMDIIEYAKYGELAQLNVIKQLNSSVASEVIDAEKKLISYINLGLIELYKRFNLKTDEEVLIMAEDQTLYTITSANFNSVYMVYDEKGDYFPINDEEDNDSIMTPSYNILQIANAVPGEAIYVIYNASPDKLVWAENLNTIVVGVPPAMLEALLHYIGYRGHAAMNGNVDAGNNTHYNRFEASCASMLELGVVPTDDRIVSGTKLEDKGFV